MSTYSQLWKKLLSRACQDRHVGPCRVRLASLADGAIFRSFPTDADRAT